MSKAVTSGKKALYTVLVPLITLLFGFIAVEYGLHWLAEHRYGKGKLFEPDPVTGWRTLANLEIQRLNPEGQPWHVITDEHGFRETSSWRQEASTRLLILGDSLAFGQGVNIQDRFDMALMAKYPKLAVVNAGTMGYGPLQQILRGQPFFPDLGAGDVLLLVTCSNDFMDITRSMFAGRRKPRFYFSEENQPIEELSGSKLIGSLRDKSYIASRIIAYFFEDASFSPEAEREGLILYEALIRAKLLPLTDRGVRIMIGYYDYSNHQDNNDTLIQQTYNRICSVERVDCILINEAIDQKIGESRHIFQDGHWNRAGNEAFAKLLIPLFGEN